MANFKLTTARKTHICAHCGNPIAKGQQYHLFTDRMPIYEGDPETGSSSQSGIYYLRERSHVNCEESIAKNGMNGGSEFIRSIINFGTPETPAQ